MFRCIRIHLKTKWLKAKTPTYLITISAVWARLSVGAVCPCDSRCPQGLEASLQDASLLWAVTLMLGVGWKFSCGCWLGSSFPSWLCSVAAWASWQHGGWIPRGRKWKLLVLYRWGPELKQHHLHCILLVKTVTAQLRFEAMGRKILPLSGRSEKELVTICHYSCHCIFLVIRHFQFPCNFFFILNLKIILNLTLLQKWTYAL